MLVLETERLVLRSFTDADLETFVTYRSDPEVARYQGWNAPFTEEQGRAFIEEMTHKQPATPNEWYQLAIERKSDGRMLGDIAFVVKGADAQQAELGLTLARAEQGQGYGTEAVRRLLDYLLCELKLHRVFANCDVENPAAFRVLERIGMRREAHFVENLWFKGGWASEYWYAILDREWQERK